MICLCSSEVLFMVGVASSLTHCYVIFESVKETFNVIKTDPTPDHDK